MRLKGIVLGAVLASGSVIINTAAADYQYMRWSDSTVEEKWSYGNGDYALVEYEMPSGYNVVEIIEFYTTAEQNVVVAIFNDGRQLVYFTPYSPQVEGWGHVNPGYVITGTFYVGLRWAVSNAPKIGVDTTSPHHRDKMWINDGGNWSHPINYGDFMVGVGVNNTSGLAGTSLGRVKAIYN